MLLVKDNGVDPIEVYSFAQLRADNPNTSFPANPSDELLASFDTFKLTDGALPPKTPAQNHVSSGIVKDGDKYVREWTVEDKQVEDVALTPVQFHAMLDILGTRATVNQAINSLYTGRDRTVALTKLERSSEYDYTDPMMDAIRQAIGMTQAEFDAAWLDAATI